MADSLNSILVGLLRSPVVQITTKVSTLTQVFSIPFRSKLKSGAKNFAGEMTLIWPALSNI